MDIIRTAQMRGEFPQGNLIVLLWQLLPVILAESLRPILPWFPYLIGVGAIAGILLIFIIILKIRFIRSQMKIPSVFLEIIPNEVTLQTHFSTEQLFSILHKLIETSSWLDEVIGNKRPMGFELVSIKEKGIRYIIKTSLENVDLLKKNLEAYLPGVSVIEIEDYLPPQLGNLNKMASLLEFTYRKHFAIPLITQSNLKEHDPIAYITNHMTHLQEGELISLQLVATSVYSNTHPKETDETRTLAQEIFKGKDIFNLLYRPQNTFVRLFWSFILFIPKLWIFFFMLPFQLLMWFWSKDTKEDMLPLWIFSKGKVKSFNELPLKHQELQKSVSRKIDSDLFEVSFRLFILAGSMNEVGIRQKGFLSSLAPFQSPFQKLVIKDNLFINLLCFIPFVAKLHFRYVYTLFRHRFLSLDTNPIFSTSEMASLYHFPYTATTKTEDLITVHSKKFPAPLSVKNQKVFNVVFGTNIYGDLETSIGLTDDDRSRHVYMIGQTGSGKSTVMFHMTKDDIQKGRGVCVIDPHGDLAESLLAYVPTGRINDCIYFNPFDIHYPIGINLLEIPQGLSGDELEQERELVCESVISIFRRVFAKDDNVDAHRIEYILRNTIYTASTVKDATIFMVYELLTNPTFQKSIVKNLEDENLKNFWKNEYGKAGNYQIVKMVSGVTAKIGRFLFSPTAKRILEQPKSTINFDDILDSGKVLICNLAEGKLGEDTSQLLGTTVIAKIQQAAMRRARKKLSERTPFYLFIDEFQNFATSSFVKLLSGGRKFGLRLTLAEQSTAQQDDRNLVNVILANTGTVICFRTASPMDENLMLAQFSPYIAKSDIVNLPRFHFYMKLSSLNPEEPFSGTTLPMPVDNDEQRTQQVIEASRKNYVRIYQKPEQNQTDKVSKEKPKIKRKENTKSAKLAENENQKDTTVGSLT